MAKNVLDKLEVIEIRNPNKTLVDDGFPGYKNVSINYDELKRKLKLDEWRDALSRRKGVYLITDKTTGKLYVGSAYGENGILGRWETYLNSGYDKNEVENGAYPNKKGLSQILCKHRNAVQIEQNIFKVEVVQAAAALFSK